MCQLPDCRCSRQSIPDGLAAKDVPQIVYLTFDDAITVTNFPFYQKVLFNRQNPNGANISATFFITHEYTDYSLVHEMWRQGHEISLHSITHQTNTQYWSSLNESMWKMEIVDQVETTAMLANIPKDAIKGVRAPYLQLSGNPTYEALSKGGIKWECSRPTWNQRTPGLWPYTNNFLSTQDCQIAPCPTGTYPGFWTVPMIDMIADNTFPCAMLDECNDVPTTADGLYNLLQRNFLEQYNGNRAPFGIFTHAAYFIGDSSDAVARTQGYERFLDYLLNLKDVYIVSISKALEWVQDPTVIANITNFEPWMADGVQANGCGFPRQCTYDVFGGSQRYMKVCSVCPPNYPWLGNPLGN